MIRDFLVRYALAELWAIIWHFGIIGLVFFAALAWAWLVPIFKKTALWVALGAAIIGLTAGTYTKLGADYVRAKWEAAEDAAVAIGLEARNDAVADVKRAGPRGVSNDTANRDNDKGSVRPVVKNPVQRKQ
jgi:hypothetical protein